jgi:hypothetical protein
MALVVGNIGRTPRNRACFCSEWWPFGTPNEKLFAKRGWTAKSPDSLSAKSPTSAQEFKSSLIGAF